MSSEHIAVVGLALTAVGLVFSLAVILFRLARQLGAPEKQVSINTAEKKDMATKRDLENQTAAMRAEFSGQTGTLKAEFSAQTTVLSNQAEAIKADIAASEKRNEDRLDRIETGLKDEIKDLKTTLQVRSEQTAS